MVLLSVATESVLGAGPKGYSTHDACQSSWFTYPFVTIHLPNTLGYLVYEYYTPT